MKILFGDSRVARLGPLVAAVALALGCRGCACTQIGCADGARIIIHREGAPLRLAANLDLDGTKVECTAPPATGGGGDSCRPPLASLHGSARDLTVEIANLAPKRITVTLLDGTTAVAERTFAPRYEKLEVDNGVGCGDLTCHNADETWTLP